MLEAALSKAEPSSVIIERVLINEGSIQLVRVNFKIFMCLVIKSEYLEGTSRNPIGTYFPMNEL